MTDRILLVDDEPRILDALRRNLHGIYAVDTAPSGAGGLELIAAIDTPYAVAVSDMMMPGMNGAEFLARAHDASPDTIQMILSGQADLTTTIAAVNDGNLFRFLTKPCESDDLVRALEAALAQHRLVNSERQLLEHTLNGAIGVLTELMSTANPMAFHRTERVKALVHSVEAELPVSDAWELRVAAMLGQIGLLAVPDEVLAEIGRGADTSAEATAVYRSHPALASDLIQRIPRLERVAEWVAAQPVTMAEAAAPGSPAPPRPVGETLGHDVYATVMAFTVGVESGIPTSKVVGDLAGCGRYRRDLLDRILRAHTRTVVRKHRQVTGAELTVGMRVEQDVLTVTGLRLIRGGEILTESMAIRLRHFSDDFGLVEPIEVWI